MWRDGLTVIALASGLPDRKPNYLTFEQATEGGAIEVQEAAVQSVPTVEASVGPMPVLLLGGDTIIGGAQNRIINVTILLKAATKTATPVSCLELGRWNSGRHFRASRTVDLGLRRMVAEQVHASPMHAADQGAIWQRNREAPTSISSTFCRPHGRIAVWSDSASPAQCLTSGWTLACYLKMADGWRAQ
jgi:hypothetical protein